jgi:hypothetical protein
MSDAAPRRAESRHSDRTYEKVTAKPDCGKAERSSYFTARLLRAQRARGPTYHAATTSRPAPLNSARAGADVRAPFVWATGRGEDAGQLLAAFRPDGGAHASEGRHADRVRLRLLTTITRPVEVEERLPPQAANRDSK